MICSSPLLTIARRQRRLGLEGAKGLFLLVFWSLLVGLSVWASTVVAQGDREHHARSKAAAVQAYARWAGQYDAESWRPVLLSTGNPILLQKPPAPARALASGVEDAGGAWVIPIGYYLRELEGRKAELSPLGSLMGGLDLAGLVAIVGALGAIALGHDAVSGERERGTLALHFAGALRRRTFLLGKALGCLQALSIALWGPLALGVLALFATGALAPSPGNAGRAIAFLALSGLYLACWSMLAVAVSTLVRASASAFAALAGTWLLLAIAVPKLAIALSAQLAPVGAPALLEQRLAAGLEVAKGVYKRELKAFQHVHGRRPDARETARLKLDYYEAHRRETAAVVAAYEGAIASREGWVRRLGGLSPAFAYQQAASELAGTDAGRHRAFLSASNRYLVELKRYAEQRTLDGKDGPPSLEELPALAFDETSFGTGLLRALGAGWPIGLALLLAFGLGMWGFRRYDLRTAS